MIPTFSHSHYLPVSVWVEQSPSKIFPSCQVRSKSEPVPFETRLISFCLSILELVYFLLGLDWTCFKPDLLETESFDNLNTSNGDGEDGCKKVNQKEYSSRMNRRVASTQWLPSLSTKTVSRGGIILNILRISRIQARDKGPGMKLRKWKTE